MAAPGRSDASEVEAFRLLFNSILDYAVILLTPAGAVSTWNVGAERIKGYKAEDVVGKHFSMFYPEADMRAGKPQRELDEAVRAGRFEDEGWRVRRDGSRFWANVVITALRKEDGSLLGFAKLTRDLTERKRVEERFRVAVDAAPNAMIMVDRQGRVVLVNARAEGLFGYMRAELLGMPIETLVPQRLRSPHPGQRESFARDPKARPMGAGRDLFGLKKDGSEVPVEIGLNPITTEEGDFVLASVVDITERKRAADLRAAKDAIEVANRELKTFSFSVAHDLRAPLRKLSGFSQLLEEGLAGKLDEKSRDYLARIQRHVVQMDGIIESFLNLSRLLQREPQSEALDLSAMAAGIAEELSRSQPERKAEFVIAPGVTARGDREFLLIVLRNLLENAWKFTGKHPSARIEFGSAADEGQRLYFVKDDGAGFDMSYADKLFGVFKSLHAPGEFPGTGVGLATVQRVLQRHGGRIWAEGAVERGAVFYFTLGGISGPP